MPELDSGELEIIEWYERDEWQRVPEQAEELKRCRQYARETFKKYA